jgi:hypothetical protein
MLAYHPITKKEIRILNSDASISKKKRTLFISPTKHHIWDTVFEVKEMATQYPSFSVCLDLVSGERLKEISDNSYLLFVKKEVVERIGLEGMRLYQIRNIICLEEMAEMYPQFGPRWNGTLEDAYILIASLLKYNILVGSLQPTAQREPFLHLTISNEAPFRLWWITQYYQPPKAKRKQEIDTCLRSNLQSPLVDKVILLNEKEEDYSWLDDKSKVEEKIIGHRLTYQDVLKEVLTFPDDVIVAFANADICIDSKSWKQLWEVDLTNTCLALLRYDMTESNVEEEATLFGPRADSQDTWVLRAADVKKREDILKNMDIRFGQMGCDNAFALEIFRKKFLVVNPAYTLKTFHYHVSGVRNYKTTDVVNNPFFMYVQPSGFHDLEPVLHLQAKHTIKPQSIQRPLFGSAAPLWTDKMNRNLATGSKPWNVKEHHPITPEAEYAIEVKDCFQNENGLCYDQQKMYVGKGARAQKKWSQSALKRMPTTIESKKGLIIPFDTEVMENRERYILEYLSRVLRLRAMSNETGEFFCPNRKEIVEALHMFQWETEMPLLKYEKDVQVWHHEAVAMPVSENNVLLTEDVDALRKACKLWNPVFELFGNRNRIVIVQDDKVITDELATELEEVLDHAWNVRVVYAGKTSGERMWEMLRGAWGIVIGSEVASAWNWLLPKGAVVVEAINPKQVPNATALHMSAVCGLEHRFSLNQRDLICDEIWAEYERTKQTADTSGQALPIVWLPRKDMEGYFAHAGDSFREMARLWAKQGYCQVKEHLTATQCWWGEVGAKGVLLYDRPNHDWRLSAPLPEKDYAFALYGNPKPPLGDEKASPWFFWPRRPALVEKLVSEKVPERGWSERKAKPVFYGKIENRVQDKRRNNQDWSLVCEDYTMVKGVDTAYALSHEEYLLALSKARFGLCLAGYGYKCHREVECMAMGCVPVVAPEVDMDSYAEPPQEGIHYIRVQTPEDVSSRLSEIGEQEWMTMSQACRAWWKRNCSCEGSFALTKKLLENKI